MLKRLINYIMKRCFRQGNDVERRMLLKAMIKAQYEEYTEDNWYSRTYWLVEEILKADDNVGKFPIDEGRVFAGLRSAVHDAIQYKKQEY